MAIAMSVLVGDHSYYWEFSGKSQALVSSSKAADVFIPELDRDLVVTVIGRTVNLTVKMKTGSVKKTTILLDQFAVLDNEAQIGVYFTEAIPQKRTLLIPENCDFSFGRIAGVLENGEKNDFLLQLPFISKQHFHIFSRDGEVSAYNDPKSTNGLYLNGRRIRNAKLKDGDVLSIWTVRITYTNDHLIFENVGNKLQQAATTKNAVQRKKSPQIAAKNPVRPETLKYTRTPRLLESTTHETIHLEKPPQAGSTPKMNWLSILATPIMMILLMVVLILLTGMSATMWIMSGTMSVISTIVAVINYRKQKKQHYQIGAVIDEKYHAYLTNIAEEISRAHDRQRKNLLAANPAPAECVTIAKERHRNLWERCSSDEDFLCARLGVGTVRANVMADYQRAQVIIEENPLENEAIALADKSNIITDAPILCNMLENKQIGMVGNRAAEIQLARNMIVELTTSHAYDELKIIVLIPQREVKAWNWLRWLPHCMPNEQDKRYIYTSIEEAQDTLDSLAEELAIRAEEQRSHHSMVVYKPHYLFIVATGSDPWIEKHAIAKYIFSNEPCGVSSLFVYDRHVPKECRLIIEAGEGQGQIYAVNDSNKKETFAVDRLSVEMADAFARALAPLYVDIETSGAGIPTKISFLEGYGVSQVEQLDIAARWSRAKTYESISVPIAARTKGIFNFSVYDKVKLPHGAHGIVAGMPGAGKTEMVQSWLLSLAVNYSPQDVSFVLIDFKGTGFLAPFRNLPHLAGSISDLDKNIDRCLIALETELERRKAILAKYGTDIKLEINSLNKGFAEGRYPEKLPCLIIAIDEYAEFKKTYPDFGTVIDSIAAVGGTLGMYLVLMTQVPSGIIDAKVADKIAYRWCLKVENKNASKEMLRIDDAAKITNSGRAFVRVGEVIEQVQAFWSGAPYRPDDTRKEETDLTIWSVELDGKRKEYSQNKTQQIKTGQVEITEVVNYISAYCADAGMRHADKVWDEELPQKLPLTSLLSAVFANGVWPESKVTIPAIGLADDPHTQSQYPLAVDFARNGHVAVYGLPTTGKTTLLKTLIMSTALTRRPDQTNIYVMDFGGRNLGIFRDLPHIGGIANDNEPERLKKLSLLIEDELQSRTANFAKIGVGNIASYREESDSSIADIVLVVDNLGVAVKAYPELDEFFQMITATGANYGIYLVATTVGTSLPFRIAQNIKCGIALQLNEKSDYSGIVGRVSANLQPIMGRGYAKGEYPLEFQTALPATGKTDGEISGKIREIIWEMNECWSGDRPLPIPEMPERVRYGSIRTNKIVLGLSAERVSPIYYDYEHQHFLLISGKDGSGKSNMLQAIARQMKEKLGGRLYALDVLGGGMADIWDMADRYLTAARDIDSFFEEIRPELQRRFDEKQANANMHFDPIIIAVDDYGPFFKAISNDTAARLFPIVKIAKGLAVYLLLAGDSYDLANLKNKGQAVSVALAKGSQAIMLGGCMADHDAIQVTASYTQKNAIMKELDGIYVNGLEYVGFKPMESRGGGQA